MKQSVRNKKQEAQPWRAGGRGTEFTSEVLGSPQSDIVEATAVGVS